MNFKILFFINIGLGLAKHFRGATYGIISESDQDDLVKLSWTTTWARSKSYYTGVQGDKGCQQSDVTGQVQNDKNTNIDVECSLGAGGHCFTEYELFYTVTYVQDEVSDDNQYCYGSDTMEINQPGGPAEIKWEKCCWVDLTKDNGDVIPEDSK